METVTTAAFFLTVTLSVLRQKPIATNVQTTQTAALSVVVSHSPPRTEDGGGRNVGVNIDFFSVGGGIGAALLVLVMASVIIAALLVCLRGGSKELNPSCLDVGNNGHTSNTFILTFTNPTFLDAGSSGHALNTNIPTPTNQAHLEYGPICDEGFQKIL